MSMREAFRQVGLVPDEPDRRDDVSRRGDRRGRGGDDRSRGRLRGQAPPPFPDSYFTLDEQGNRCLRTEFVARDTVDPLAALLANANPRLTTGQVRRFFNHCRDIERQLKVEGVSWQQVAARFESLSSHAQYASSGRERKIPPEFQQFIDRNVRMVASSEDPGAAFLLGFVPHFEALVGFGVAYMRDR